MPFMPWKNGTSLLNPLAIIEYNLSFDKSNWFSITQGEIENIKGYIRGSIKDMQSLLIDVENNSSFGRRSV